MLCACATSSHKYRYSINLLILIYPKTNKLIHLSVYSIGLFKQNFLFAHRVLELIHEAKWLTRLDIAIPESAQSVLEQEARFKKYRAHLELVLSEYSLVCQQVPHHLKSLFQPHINNVHQQLQPGLSTLAWNSMNIGQLICNVHEHINRHFCES